MRIDLGKWQFIAERARGHAGWVQFLIICWMGVHTGTVKWWWLLAGVPAGIAFMWADLKYILPKYLEYSTRKNPAWHQMMDKIGENNANP